MCALTCIYFFFIFCLQIIAICAACGYVHIKSSQIKSSLLLYQQHKLHNSIQQIQWSITPQIHFSVAFDTAKSSSIAKGAGNPVGLKGSRSVNTVLAHKPKQQNGIQWLPGYTVMSDNTSKAVIINIISMVGFFLQKNPWSDHLIIYHRFQYFLNTASETSGSIPSFQIVFHTITHL